MNKLELYVFNVGHGLSIALVEYPEKYVSLIDLGSSESFSPYNYLTEKLQLHPDILYIPILMVITKRYRIPNFFYKKTFINLYTRL
jgi:hypothetical protein